MAQMTVDDAINLLALLVKLEPIGQQLVMSLAKKLEGKTTEEIAAGSDAIFDEVIATAQAEIAATQSGTPAVPATPATDATPA